MSEKVFTKNYWKTLGLCVLAGMFGSFVGVQTYKADDFWRNEAHRLQAEVRDVSQERDELRTTLNENNMAAEINEGRLSIICDRAPEACKDLE